MRKIKRFAMALALTASMVISSTISALAAAGWQANNGVWNYVRADGQMAKEQWVKEGDNMYWIEPDGSMAMNKWHQESNKWFWLDGNGVAATGWVEIDGKWYYFYEDHSMAVSTTIDSYTVGRDGAWRTDL